MAMTGAERIKKLRDKKKELGEKDFSIILPIELKNKIDCAKGDECTYKQFIIDAVNQYIHNLT